MYTRFYGALDFQEAHNCVFAGAIISMLLQENRHFSGCVPKVGTFLCTIFSSLALGFDLSKSFFAFCHAYSVPLVVFLLIFVVSNTKTQEIYEVKLL